MAALVDERYFMQVQLQEIQRYLNHHKSSDPNTLALGWIETHAAAFRKHWEAQQLA